MQNVQTEPWKATELFTGYPKLYVYTASGEVWT